MSARKKPEDDLVVPATDRQRREERLASNPQHANRGNGEPADMLTTTEARQGTGPRSMVTVLFVSMGLAAAFGAFIVAYFVMNSPSEITPTLPPAGQTAPTRTAPN